MLYKSIANAATLAVLVAFIGSFDAKETHANPACGATLVDDTTFDGDLDCSGIADDTAALVIGADNIIVDLKGFELFGPSFCVKVYPAFCTGGDSDGTGGILIDGFDDVTIKGSGIISGFNRGVRVIDALGIRIEDLEASGNAFSAVRVRGNSTVIIDRANFHDNFNDAMGLSAGSRLTVLNSRINHNHASGMFIFQATLDLRHNEIKDNVRSAVTLWRSDGTIMHNEIRDNNVIPSPSTDRGQISLVAPGSLASNEDIVVRCNKISGGFSVDAAGAPATPLFGAVAPGGIGIRLNDTVGMGRVEITRNQFMRTPVAVYVTGGAGTLDVYRNTFKQNGIDFGFENGSGSTTTVDAENNLFHPPGSGVATIDLTDTGGMVDVDPALDNPDHCGPSLDLTKLTGK